MPRLHVQQLTKFVPIIPGSRSWRRRRGRKVRRQSARTQSRYRRRLRALTTTMRNQKTVVEAIEKEGLRAEVKIMVGGAPVTRRWAEEIGADGYAKDAMSAVALAQELMQQKLTTRSGSPIMCTAYCFIVVILSGDGHARSARPSEPKNPYSP